MIQAVGIVGALGDGIDNEDLFIGSPVATIVYGGFAEFSEVTTVYTYVSMRLGM